MPHHTPTLIFVSLLALATTTPAQDPVRDALELAHKQFRAGRESAKTALLEALKKAAASSKTDEQRDRFATDLAAFSEHGTLPASAPVAARAFELKLVQLVDSLQKAQVDAVVRFRKAGQDDDAGRVEERMEKMRPEIAALLARDLRCQIDVAAACPAGSWTWSGTSLKNTAAVPGALRLFSGQGFPTSYELSLEIERVSGASELHIAFPYVFAGKRALGFLALSSDDIVIAATEAKDAETSFHRSELLGPDKRILLTLTIEDGTFKLAVGDREAMSVELGKLAAGPEPLTQMTKDAQSPFTIPTEGADYALHQARMRDLQAGTVAVPAKPQQVLAQGSTWDGTWDASSGVQEGICRSMEVTRRDASTLVLRVTTNNGGVFDFDLRIDGKKLTLVNMTHVRTAMKGGLPMGFDEVSGGGGLTKDGFAFTFKTRRLQPKRRDEWTGTIRATAPK